MKLKANIAMVNLPSSNIAQSTDFYARLLGIDLVRSIEDESYHTPISEDGIDLFVAPQRHAQEQPMIYFAVDNIDKTIQDLSGLGGKVVWGPQDVAMSDPAFKVYEQGYKQEEPRGPRPEKLVARAAVLVEPGGGQVGLLQLAEHMHEHYQAGRHQKPLTDKQLRHQRRGMEHARQLHGHGARGGQGIDGGETGGHRS